MVEILWNSFINKYTFKEEINGVKSIKKIPIKFKFDDKISKYRKEELKKQILNNSD
jgi:rRNA maturation protein Nop10